LPCRPLCRSGHGEEDALEAEGAHGLPQLAHVLHHDGAVADADLALVDVEGGYELEVVLGQAGVVGQRLPQAPHADDGDLPGAREAQDAPQLGAQRGDRVAGPPGAERAEGGEVLPDLEGRDLRLLSEQVGRDALDPAGLEPVEDPEVRDEPADGGRGDAPRRPAGSPARHQRGKLSIPADCSLACAEASSEASNGPTRSLIRPFSTRSVTPKPMASRRWRCGSELSRDA